MRLNLLIDETESLLKGPGRRAKNLMTGLDRIGVMYDICSDDYEWSVGLQCNKVFNCWEMMPSYSLIGPNVMHDAVSHTGIATKFRNYFVQSQWVAELWKWTSPDITRDYNFYVYPASVDLSAWKCKDGNATANCLLYTKYQSGENREVAQLLYKSRSHSVIPIVYGEYTQSQLQDACLNVEYCIYNSCCEKSSNALMEIMACGVPIYVIEQKRWIGNDKFDQCSAAPHFDDRCGMIGDFAGKGFDDFYSNVKNGKYDPYSFVKENYTCEKVAADLVEVVKQCHG
jgi:hypothetical protein